MRKLQRIQIRNFTEGVWRSIQNNIAPLSSYKLGINLDSEKKLGSLTIRKGLTLVGSQLVADKSFYGIHHHIDASGDVLFAVAGDGTIYDVTGGTYNLTGDTVELRTRFITYLGSTLRFNGTDAVKEFNGSAWVSTGGAFDLANIPNLSLGVEWKDRVYGVDNANPDILLYSGLANPTTKQVSWTTGNGSIVMEQEDGGGGITALVKVSGYLLVFKQNGMKRWNGYGTFPEELINQGAPSQEAICVGRGMAMVFNHDGIWATNGGRPQRISRPIQEIIEAVPSSYLSKVTSYCDDVYAQWSIGDVKIDGVTHSNVVLKFNLDDNSWNVRTHSEVVEFPTKAIYDDKRRIVCGNDDGEIFMMDEGTTDNGKSIPFQLDLHTNDFGIRGRMKTITQMSAFVSGTMNAQILERHDSDNPADYSKIANIQDRITSITSLNLRCSEIDIRITGISSSGGTVIDGIEFDESGVQLNKTKQ